MSYGPQMCPPTAVACPGGGMPQALDPWTTVGCPQGAAPQALSIVACTGGGSCVQGTAPQALSIVACTGGGSCVAPQGAAPQNAGITVVLCTGIVPCRTYLPGTCTY